MIRWQDHGERVERAVKILIRDLHPSAQGIDGSGGDLGRDIRWDGPEGLVIFEVKSHTERLTNSQRRKITKSLANAAEHEPVRWVLILPHDPTPAEEAWFDRLRGQFAAIQLEWRGRDWLDNEFAKREYLVRYVEGPLYVLAERAKELGHEQAVLANCLPDVTARLDRLWSRTQELSPYWRVDVATGPGGQVLSFSEGFPGAASLDPVTLRPVFSFQRMTLRRGRPNGNFFVFWITAGTPAWKGGSLSGSKSRLQTTHADSSAWRPRHRRRG